MTRPTPSAADPRPSRPPPSTITSATPESYREGTRDHDVSQNIDALLRGHRGRGAVHHSGSWLSLAATSRASSSAATRPWARRRKGRASRWRAPRPAARCCTRTSSSSSCRPRASTARIRQREACSMHRARHWATVARPSCLAQAAWSAVRVQPRGENQDGFNGQRYGCFYDLENWRACVTAAGFEEIPPLLPPAGPATRAAAPAGDASGAVGQPAPRSKAARPPAPAMRSQDDWSSPRGRRLP